MIVAKRKRELLEDEMYFSPNDLSEVSDGRPQK
jgi:hypothetical protein